MRGVLLILLAVGSVFIGGLFTMWISDAIVSPYGLHGFTYAQALKISFISTISFIVAGIISIGIKVLSD